MRVEGWLLFTGEGAHWVQDLDLAERAELSRGRDIRAVIKKAIDDGLMTIAGGARDGHGPQVRAVLALVTIGSGATREVTEYYLNEEAAHGFRDKEEHRLRILDQKRHGEGQVVCYLWSETVFDALQRHFERASITA
jgi:hypothetical protein